ncbi:TonB-dependent receptor [Caulobacter sp.]|uniref:TonB-dependent siderophore receptor n=1 Tax=Caulobacter sp. TaxID=78 RepID=UPI0031D7FA1E
MPSALVLACLCGPAFAQTVAPAQPVAATTINEVHNFKVAGGRLSDVVTEIAAQARATIETNAQGPSDKVAGVEGLYTLRGAIEQALKGTDWQVEISDAGVVRLYRTPAGSAVVEEIVVRARRTDFVESSSSMLTRTDTPLRQTPATIDTVTSEVFKSQNAISIAEAFRNLPGVVYTQAGITTQAMIGQTASGSKSYTNGLANSGLTQNAPLTDIDAIEVLKGPASILTGASIAGGVVNYVPKRATGREEQEYIIGYGTGQEWIGSLDVGGAISKEKGLFWRFAASGQNADTLPQGTGDHPRQFAVNPMFGYRGDGVKLDVTLQYYTKFSPFLPLNAYLPDSDSFAGYGDAIDEHAGNNVKSKRATFDFEKDLTSTDELTLKLRARGQYQSAKSELQAVVPVAYDLFGLGAYLTALSQYSEDKVYSQYVDLYGKFSTGKLEHQAIIAADLQDSHNFYIPTLNYGFGSAALAPIDKTSAGYDTKIRQYGFIAQDQMTLGKLHGLLGVRYTRYRSHLTDPSGAAQGATNEDIVTPTVGIVYDISPKVSAYASYTQSFEPYSTAYRTADGSTLKPNLRSQYEIGAKTGLFDDHLIVNASLYRFDTSNSLALDPNDPAFYVTSGGTKGKGGEISISGSITSSLKMLFGVQHSKSTWYDLYGAETPVLGVPNTSVNLWAIQSFKLGGERTLDVGLGGNYTSGFNAQDAIYATSYKIDREYLQINSSLGLTVGRYKINAMINNLFDRRNYLPGQSISALNYDVPRSYRVTLSAKF